MRRRRHVFAASMVVTAALAPGCDKQSSPETRERRTNNPPMPAPDGGAMAKTPMLDAASAPAAKLIAPDPSFKAGNGATISLNQDTWTCQESFHVDCPTGARCNPPAPEPVACPDDLLPSLAPGVVATARKNRECFLGDVEVRCPAGAIEIQDPVHGAATIRYRETSKDCWRTWDATCDPGVKCNPPEPEKVPCPDGLTPLP